MPTLLARLTALLFRSRSDRELDEEMRLHLDLLVARLRADGLDDREARRRARIEFGPITSLREEARDACGVRAFEELVRDVRFGFRTLIGRPGFLTVVLLTLGVGVGGSAAIFGAVNSILLKPLPYPDADRVMAIWQHDRRSGDQRQEVAPANFLDWRERSRPFEPLSAMEPYGLDWLSPDGPVYLHTWLVYEGFFDVFRTPPLLGRTFRLEEHQPGRGDVVVLGYDLWRTRFAGAEDVVGRVLTLDGRPYTVVGVMPRGFAIPSDDIVWAPKVLEGWEENSRTSAFYTVFGRLREGVGIGEGVADLDRVATQLSHEHPRTNRFTGVAVVPLPEQIVGSVRTALWLLFGSVVLVLAVVAASVASMQFARAAARGREFALRSALGAGRGRVVRQLVTENLVLGALGTALGFALARLAVDAIRRLAPADLPRIAEMSADRDVLVFAACLSLLVVLSTGIVPILVAGRARLQPALGGRTFTGGRVLAHLQAALVVFQFCASLVLLVGAGLLMRSFVAVLNQPAGFRTDGVVALTVQTWSHYPDGAARAGFVREVVERLSAAPGIAAAGMTSSVPLMETIGAELAPLTIEGAPPLPDGQSPPLVHFTIAAGGLFEAFSIPLIEGRLFETRDHAASTPVAIINEAFRKQHFPNVQPIGRRILLARASLGAEPRVVVGVVGDVRRFGLHESPRPGVYLPHAQAPTGANAFIVRGEGRPADLLRQTKRTIWQLNPAIAIYQETTMADLVDISVGERRFLLVLLSVFAAMAVVLAAAGIFGLMSFVTAQRTREYGVRLALGARREQLLGVVLRRAMALAVVGISCGLLAALALTRVLTGMLYGVTPFDPLTFVVAGFVLCVTAALAGFYPATRAANVNVSELLQNE